MTRQLPRPLWVACHVPNVLVVVLGVLLLLFVTGVL